MPQKTIDQVLEDARDYYLEDSTASGVDAIHIEKRNGQPTLVLTFASVASRCKQCFPDHQERDGLPVGYAYACAEGPGSVIDVSGPCFHR